MRFIDLEDKMVMLGELDGEEKTIAFICYHKIPEEKRIITGVYFCAPHLDPYQAAVDLMDAVRVDHPFGEWSIETPPKWCGRPELLDLIQMGIDDGHKHYDVVGEYSEDPVEYEYDIEFFTEAQQIGAGEEFPTVIIRRALEQVDEQIAERLGEN